MSSLLTKKNYNPFLGIMSYLEKVSPVTMEVYKPLRKLTSSKSEWMWNSSYQHLYDKAKAIIKNNATMTFYN